MRYAPAILVGRFVRFLARLRKPGGGSAVPGLVVNRLAPGYLPHALGSFPDGLVVVSGSSGKSTTTKMLVGVLRAHDRSVFTNPSTANIAQGLTSALLERADVRGRVPGDLAVLEMDEGHGARVTAGLHPDVVVLTNVMVDQIDRFHDSEAVAGMLGRIASRATKSIVLNADDAYLVQVASAAGRGVAVERFGVTGEVLEAAPRGLGNARTSGERLEAGEGVRIVALDGDVTTLEADGRTVDVRLPSRGIHYAVDAAAAIAGARAILGRDFDLDAAARSISEMPAVFGRGERVNVRGTDVEFVLVQNPSSFQLNVDGIAPGTEQILFAMGSDVRDPSYFWPVDASGLGSVRIVSGSKAHEAALQLAYDGVGIDRVEPDLPTALDDFLALPEPSTGVKTIVFTADSMRRTRAHLGLAEAKEDA
ncbi:glutamate ligase [Agromyces rhizosphaerae]|uniref:Glutamate ligase n=1 Tax=Agromyces rhizosphaerae TaxID=88374 RepID=A0A9W6D1A5_9MICO|nr:Mur ligase family protein [Agromyces rhizosphaerae]GLI28972.1 glutamate ligase [Agromyces rhizosphaerae]